MAKAKRAILSSAALIRVVTGFFFVVLGLTGILPESEGLFSLSSDRTTLEIIFGVIEILCGGFILVDAFRNFPRKTSVLVLLVIFSLWVLRVVITQFVQGIDMNSKGIDFNPTFWTWLFNMAVYAVISCNLWIMYKSE